MPDIIISYILSYLILTTRCGREHYAFLFKKYGPRAPSK